MGLGFVQKRTKDKTSFGTSFPRISVVGEPLKQARCKTGEKGKIPGGILRGGKGGINEALEGHKTCEGLNKAPKGLRHPGAIMRFVRPSRASMRLHRALSSFFEGLSRPYRASLSYGELLDHYDVYP